MQVPLEITFRGLPKNEAVEELIRKETDKLHRFFSDIISCHVAVEKPHLHADGNPYRVRIEVTLPPGLDLVVSKDPGDNDEHDKLPAVVRKAFDAMERQVKQAAEKRRGDVKSHDEPIGLVARLFAEQGYGFLTTPEGREVYFHRNSVLHGDFERLDLGTEVRFAWEMGEKGPQATTVQLVNKPGGPRSGA